MTGIDSSYGLLKLELKKSKVYVHYYHAEIFRNVARGLYTPYIIITEAVLIVSGVSLNLFIWSEDVKFIPPSIYESK